MATDQIDDVDAVTNFLNDLVSDSTQKTPAYCVLRLIFLRARLRAAAAFFFLRILGLS
jgi:hypothetical protein